MNYNSDNDPFDNTDISMFSKRILFPGQKGPRTSGGNAGEEDSLLYEPIPIIENYRRILSRTYESPFKWFFLVFAPLNKAYGDDPEWFNTKGIDACRKKVTACEAFFISKEIYAEKIHINALVLSDQPLDDLHGKFCARSRYRIWAEETSDRHKVLDYITKEFKERSPKLFYDYLYKLPQIGVSKNLFFDHLVKK